MRNRVSKTLTLAIAGVLIAAGAVVAGQNAGATFTLSTPTQFSGVGPGEASVSLTIQAAGLVEVKQYDITISVEPADAFDLAATSFTPATGFMAPGMEVTAGRVKVGAANFSGSMSGSGSLGTFVLTTSGSYSTATQATVVVESISVGPSSTDRDAFDAATLGLTVVVNPPAPAPTISGIVPSTGVIGGGTAVTISGANFASGAAVTIGGVAATGVVFVDAGTLTATTPAGAAVGAADVVVTNPDGQAATLAGGFTYVSPPPVVTGIAPSSGLVAGGTAITVSGTGFAAGAAVTIGGVAATGVVFVDATTLTATTPAASGVGVVDVVVTNPDGQSSTLAGAFSYTIPTPTVTAIEAPSGFIAGATITVRGSGFVPGATITIGGVTAALTVVDANTMTATVPAGVPAGSVNVVVSIPDGMGGSLTGGMAYVPGPWITSVSPVSGPAAGGTAVTISGANFASGATVRFGAASAASVAFVGSSTLVAGTPPGAAGPVDVVVTNPDGQAATLAGAFTYLALIEPTMSAVGGTDFFRRYSAVGSGTVADGSNGEVSVSVRCTGAAGGPVAGQDVSFRITHNGGESVYVVGAGAAEVVPGATITVVVATNGSGIASITLDAEGTKESNSSSVSINASTSLANSYGVVRQLGVDFGVAWDVPVVAELAALEGWMTPEGSVVLRWGVVSQTGNLGWQVMRSVDNVSFEPIGELVAGDGTTDAYRVYEYVDKEAPAVGVLYYCLEQVDIGGGVNRSQVIEVARSNGMGVPVAMSLLQNFPNPFNPETTIAFEMDREAVVTLRVLDLAGQEVRTLISGSRYGAGRYESVWDGRTDAGVRVASGVYFYELKAEGFSSLKKMTLVQ